MKLLPQKKSARDTVIVGLISIAIVVILEIGAGYYYYLNDSAYKISLFNVADDTKSYINRLRATESVSSFKKTWKMAPHDLWVPFFSGDHAILQTMEDRYEAPYEYRHYSHPQ